MYNFIISFEKDVNYKNLAVGKGVSEIQMLTLANITLYDLPFVFNFDGANTSNLKKTKL